MSIPSTIDQQLLINGIGSEEVPQVTFVKSSMWITFRIRDYIYLREHENASIIPWLINSSNSSFYKITSKYSGGSLSTDVFWLWTVEDDDLYVQDIEPNVSSSPILGTKTLIKTNVTSIDVILGTPIQLLFLDKVTGSDTGLWIRYYNEITEPHIKEKSLVWS